jgi:hypothetical protein
MGDSGIKEDERERKSTLSEEIINDSYMEFARMDSEEVHDEGTKTIKEKTKLWIKHIFK